MSIDFGGRNYTAHVDGLPIPPERAGQRMRVWYAVVGRSAQALPARTLVRFPQRRMG